MSTQKKPKNLLEKARVFFLKYETKIALVLGFFLISIMSFEIGILQGEKWQQKPLIIEKPITSQEASETTLQGQNEASKGVSIAENKEKSITGTSSNCAYVGSKNSNKFYLPTCSWARSIKPENIVCFKTAQEAISQGRTESKCN